MRILWLFIFFYLSLHAKLYYAKVEPFEIREISSNVSGLIVYANEGAVGSILGGASYIKMDTEIDGFELKNIKQKLSSLKSMVEINEATVANMEISLNKKRENYKKVEALKFKSNIEKDKEFYDLISSENLYLSTKKELFSLKLQIADLEFRSQQLQRTLADKNINAKGFMLYELLVRPGKVVGVSTPLAKIADVSKAKLTLYVDADEVDGIEKKSVFVDGAKINARVSRIVKIADGKNISKYMAQIITKSPVLFSKLVKVELKDE